MADAVADQKPWDLYSSQKPWELYGSPRPESIDQEDQVLAPPTPPPPTQGETLGNAIKKAQAQSAEAARDFSFTPAFEKAQGLLEKGGAAILNEPADFWRNVTGKTPQTTVGGYDEQGRPTLTQVDKPLPFQPGQSVYTPKGTIENPTGNEAQKLVAGFMTPGNIASFPFAASKAVQAAFLMQTAPAAVQAAEKLVAPGAQPGERRQAALDFAVNAIMTHGLAHGLVKGGEPNASSQQEAAAVHGDLRAQPVSGEGEVPAQEGGGGVQPQAEAVQAEVLLKSGAPLDEGSVDAMKPEDQGTLTHSDGINYGMTKGADDVAGLQKKYDAATKEQIAAFQSGDGAAAKAAFGKANFYGGALMGATRGEHPISGSNYENFLKAHPEKSPTSETGAETTKNGPGVKTPPVQSPKFTVLRDHETGESHIVNQKGEVVASYEQNAHAHTDAAKLNMFAEGEQPREHEVEKPFLDEDDQKHFDAERKNLGADVELTDDANSKHPFAKDAMAWADHETGKIMVNKDLLKYHLEHLPKKDRATAIRSVLAEERIHLATDHNSAFDYWKNLSPWEQAIVKRRYTHGVPLDMNEVNWGHEAIRHRIQQLARMTPTELAFAVGKEKWTVKALNVVEHVIRNARSIGSFMKGRESRAILKRIQDNIQVARNAMAGVKPAAFRGRGRPKVVPTPKEQQDFILPGIESTRLAGSKIAASNVPGKEGSELPPVSEEERAKTAEAVEKHRPPTLTYQQVRDVADKWFKDEFSKVSDAINRGEHIQPKFEDFARYIGQNAYGIKPGHLHDMWQDSVAHFLTKAKDDDIRALTRSVLVPKADLPKVDEKGEVKWSSRGLRKGGNIWANMANSVLTFDSKQIKPDAMAEITEAERNAERIAATATSPEMKKWAEDARNRAAAIKQKRLEDAGATRQELKDARSANRRRQILVSAIYRKLVVPRVETADLHRNDIKFNDIRFGGGKTIAAVQGFTDSDASDPLALTSQLIDESKRRSDDPATYTKRLTLIQDRSSGKVSLVSTYRRGDQAMLRDPLHPQKFHLPLGDMLRRYRVVQSILLDEPVQNFKKTWGSLQEYQDDFGAEAKRINDAHTSGSGSMEEPDQFIHGKRVVQQTGENEGIPGSGVEEGESGHLQGPFRKAVEAETGAGSSSLEKSLGKDITPAEQEAVFQHIQDAVGHVPQTADEVERAIYEMTENPPNAAAMSALRKAAAKLPDEPVSQQIKRLAGLIYENKTDEPDTATKAAKAAYPGENAGPASKAVNQPPGDQAQPAQRSAARPQDVTKPPEATTKLSPVKQLTQDEWKAITRQARVEARNKEAAARKEIQLRNDKAEVRRLVAEGGDENIAAAQKLVAKLREQLDVRPAAFFRRKLEEKRDDTITNLAVIKNQVSKLFMRTDTAAHMASSIDGLDTIGNNMGQQAEWSVRMESSDEANKRFGFKPNFRGKKDILESTPAMLAAKGIKVIYNYDARALAEKSRLLREDPTFIAMVHNIKSSLGAVGHSKEDIATAQKNLGTAIQSRLRKTGFLHAKDGHYLMDDSARNNIDFLMYQIRQGTEQAERMANRGNLWDKFVGRRWLKSNERLMRTLEYAKAQWDNPELRNTARRVRMEMDRQYDIERDNGYSINHDPNYLPGRYDGETWSPAGVLFGGKRVLGNQFRAAAVFDNQYEAASKGPYIPATLDVASLVGSRVRQGMRSVARRMWWDSLKELRDETGKPVAREGKIGGGSPSPEYHEFEMPGGKKTYILEGYKGLVNQLTQPDRLMDWAPYRIVQESGQFLKHTVLAGDVFHLGKVGYYGASIMGRNAKFIPGWAATAIREADLDRAVDRHVIAPETRDYLKEKVAFRIGPKADMISRSRLSELYERSGLNTGQIQDAIFKDLTRHIPGFGTYNRFLFDRFTTGMMKTAALQEFDRLSKLDPDKDSRQIVKESARALNFYFGSIGRQGLFRSATMRGILRMGLLAPQWLEGLVAKELQPAKLLTSPLKSLSGRDTAFRGIGRGMVSMLVLTQVINLINRGTPTWSNPEPDHKWDAYLGGGVYWLSPLAVFNELTSDILRLNGTKARKWDIVQQIGMNKLGFAGRVAAVLASGKSPTGEYQSTTGGVLRTAAEQLVPVPISFGTLGQALAHKFIAPNLVPPVPPGQLTQKIFSTMGIKTHTGLDPVQRMNQAAAEFKQKHGITEPVIEYTDEASNSRLRYQLKIGDESAAKKTLADLRKNHSDGEILNSMEKWARRPFTSNQNEALFTGGMSDYGRQVYWQAMQQRYDEVNNFMYWLQQQPSR